MREQGHVGTTEAARLLGVQRKTLEGWRRNGSGPPFRKFGAAVRYSLSELEEWAQSRRRTRTSQTPEERATA